MPKCFTGYVESLKLQKHIKRLWKDSSKVIFDDKMYKAIQNYAYMPSEIDQIIQLSQRRQPVWCQSIKQMSQIEEAIVELTKPEAKYRGWNKHFKQSCEQLADLIGTIDDFSIPTVEEIYHAIPKPKASAGLLGLLENRPKKSDFSLEDLKSIYDYIFKENIMEADNVILPGVRTQGSVQFCDMEKGVLNYKHKTRLINIVSFEWILLEMLFSIKIQNHFNTLKFYAGGKDDNQIWKQVREKAFEFSISNVITNGFNQMFEAVTGPKPQLIDEPQILSLDFSKFDTSVPSWVIHAAFDILGNSIKIEEQDERIRYLFNVVRHKFINRTLLSWDYGTKSIKLNKIQKGIPSGSCFTQIIGSMCNWLMINTYLNRIHHKQMKTACITMGDDNLIISNFMININDLKSYLHKMFKVNINADKTKVGKNSEFEFLGRKFSVRGVEKPFYELVLKLCYPDHFRDYSREGMNAELILFGFLQLFTGNQSRFKHIPVSVDSLGKPSSEVIKALPGSVQYYLQYVKQ